MNDCNENEKDYCDIEFIDGDDRQREKLEKWMKRLGFDQEEEGSCEKES